MANNDGAKEKAEELRPLMAAVRRAIAEGNEAEAEVRAVMIAQALLPATKAPILAEMNEIRMALLVLAVAEDCAGSPSQVAWFLADLCLGSGADESWAAGTQAILAELARPE